jgi:hypothetical protein
MADFAGIVRNYKELNKKLKKKLNYKEFLEQNARRPEKGTIEVYRAKTHC